MTGEQQVIRTPEIHLRSPEFSYIKFFWSLQIWLSITGHLCISRFRIIVRDAPYLVCMFVFCIFAL